MVPVLLCTLGLISDGPADKRIWSSQLSATAFDARNKPLSLVWLEQLEPVGCCCEFVEVTDVATSGLGDKQPQSLLSSASASHVGDKPLSRVWLDRQMSVSKVLY